MPKLQNCAKIPCKSCPYRKDVPAGLWAAAEYEKLPLYDGTVHDQLLAGATRLFNCHQQNGKLCAGWVGCHDMYHNLAVRINSVHPNVFAYQSPVPLFESGAEACAHGLSGIDSPDSKAQAAITKLVRLQSRVKAKARQKTTASKAAE